MRYRALNLLIAGLALEALPHANAQDASADLTSLVNLFIGTGSSGNAFPGSAIPHAMAKVGIDVTTAPRQAGYIHDNSSISGISLMHDEGTGGNANGGYGIFPLFPLLGSSCKSTTSCTVSLSSRAALRAAGADAAKPGYFTTTFVNNIKLEATSTRRSGLIRFTFPSSTNATNNYVVVDLTNDLQRSFHGGSLSITPAASDSSPTRIKLGGTFQQSYGPSNYTVYACYDFPSSNLTSYATYKGASSAAQPDITNNSTQVGYPYSTTGVQAGALLGFASGSVTARFGVSFLTPERACANAEEEIPDVQGATGQWDWDAVQTASVSKWETVLERIGLPNGVAAEDATVVQLLYSSLYRAFLVPANLTLENPYWNNDEPFFDALFCSWDTFRTAHPLISILDPVGWSDIVRTYVDGWRNTGYIPECRSNTKAGYVQGGADGMPILGDFAAKYAARSGDLGVKIEDLYEALVRTGEDTPNDWYTVGRQNTAWKQFGYLPTDWTDPSGSTGLPTREASRAYEYALGDFAIRQAGLAIQKANLASSLRSGTNLADDIAKYANRSMNFKNMWDPSVTSDGFSGFAQRRYPNGTFAFSPPNACSPVDPVGHSCARGTDNNVGFYESSSWEMSFFAPQSMSSIIELMGGDQTFISRLDRYFSGGYFSAGNEPSFETPWLYHYVNRPDLSALRVRQTVYKYFNTGIGGIPGNDDSGAMASLLIFHILGLYPVPSSTQLLIGSPLLSSYTIKNSLFGTTTTFKVENFDKSTLKATVPAGGRVYVQSVSINGVKQGSRCAIRFEDVTGGGEIVIEVGSDVPSDGCGEARPDSLATGGFV